VNNQTKEHYMQHHRGRKLVALAAASALVVTACGSDDSKDAASSKPVLVRYFGGAAYMDYLTGSGILSKDQVDGSYTGDPALFIADEGKSAQQGFGSAEPYLYQTELKDWGKPVKYQYINDIGWKNYAQSIATKPENITTYADCFAALVPMIQQSSVDYLTDPTHGTKVILDAVASFGTAFGWTYTEGAAQYGVETIKADGLQANDPASGVLGQFDMDRVQGLIDIAVPIYKAQGATPKDGLKPEDIVTNQFIDAGVHLPTSDAATPSADGLASICPETIVFQTDWMPEAEHGFLYNLVGDGYEMNADKAYVTGPLVAGGVDQGVKIQIRSGGLPQQFTPVTQIMYNDPDILAGFVYTDEAIQFSGSEFPTVAVMSGFEKNPQMIMWDPATYPDVKGIKDLGPKG
jgi:hypothetical protein